MFRVPLFAGRPIGGRFGFFGAPVFRRGPFFGGGRFGGGFGFRRPIGFGGRFGRFGFRRRWPWMSGGGFGGDTGFAGAGQVSALVSWAQNCLSQAGDQSVPQNGILGPATRRAISAFQQQQQLAATGVLDNQTIAALQAACSPQDGGGDQGDAGGAQDGQ
jgi:hypothetical protein